MTQSQNKNKHHLKAIIVDWAGTVIDYGSSAPALVFIEIFQKAGVSIASQEARSPMGLDKRSHIAAILAMPQVAQRWENAQGHPPCKEDIDALYASFIPVALEVLPQHATLIPGTISATDYCRSKDIRIGSSTGYARQLMAVVTPIA